MRGDARVSVGNTPLRVWYRGKDTQSYSAIKKPYIIKKNSQGFSQIQLRKPGMLLPDPLRNGCIHTPSQRWSLSMGDG